MLSVLSVCIVCLVWNMIVYLALVSCLFPTHSSRPPFAADRPSSRSSLSHRGRRPSRCPGRPGRLRRSCPTSPRFWGVGCCSDGGGVLHQSVQERNVAAAQESQTFPAAGQWASRARERIRNGCRIQCSDKSGPQGAGLPLQITEGRPGPPLGHASRCI